MATFSKVQLSGSTNGRGIKVTQTATAGDTIHAAHASATDEIWLWAFNSDTSPHLLTLEWGGVTDPDDLIEKTIEPQDGLVLIAPGITLTNSLSVAAFAASANVVTIHGFVNRITA